MTSPRLPVVAACVGALIAASAAPAIPYEPVEITSTPSSLDLGQVAVGGSSSASAVIGVSAVATGSFTRSVAYIGVTLATPYAAITGADASLFSLEPVAASSGVRPCADGVRIVLATDDSPPCTLRVRFAPTSPGSKSASLAVSGDYVALASETTSCPSVQVNTRITPTSPCVTSVPLAGVGIAPPPPAAPVPTGSVAVDASQAVVRPGGDIRVTVVSRNTGTVALQGVRTILRVPRDFRIVTTGGGTRSGQRVVWTTTSIATGASVSRTVRLRAVSARARVSGLVVAMTATDVRATDATRVRVVPRRPVRVTG